LRRGRPRAPPEGLHEDRLARAGGRLMARVKKGDLVFVRSGADSGKRGRVLRVIPDRGLAVVEGISVRFKHLKKSQKHPQGGRLQRETPIRLSKLMPIDPKTDEATRVSYRVVDGQKRR